MKTRDVCIDARMIDSSGIGTYLRGLLSGIASVKPTDLSFTLLGKNIALPAGPWRALTAESTLYSLSEQWEIPQRFRESEASLLHAPHYNVPWRSVSRSVVTVHDIIHLKFPEFLPSVAARAYAKAYFRYIIPRARSILTVSENTKRDLIEHVKLPADRIVVAPPALSEVYRPMTKEMSREILSSLQLPSEYILYVGNMKNSKNVPFLLETYAALSQKRSGLPALVLAGRNFIPGFKEHVASAKGVHYLGETDPNHLCALYAGASLFVFPSLYEGFGLPPLEAMACGTPVLCSNRGSLPEVVGDAAVLFDPENKEEFISCLEKLLDDSQRRTSLSTLGLKHIQQFTPTALAQKTLTVYRECLS